MVLYVIRISISRLIFQKKINTKAFIRRWIFFYLFEREYGNQTEVFSELKFGKNKVYAVHFTYELRSGKSSKWRIQYGEQFVLFMNRFIKNSEIGYF